MEPDELKGDILAIVIGAALAIVVVSASFLPALADAIMLSLGR